MRVDAPTVRHLADQLDKAASRLTMGVVIAALIIGSSVVRFLLAPLLFLTAAKYLPLATELRQVLVVQAAMPAAMTPIMLARLYGGRPAIAVQVVIFTTVLSVFSLPWIITLGCRWIGLNPLLP